MRHHSFTSAAVGAAAVIVVIATLGVAGEPSLPALQGVAQSQDPGRVMLPIGSRDSTEASMRNVNFHIAQDVVLHIRRLHGFMHGDSGFISFETPKTYFMNVHAAEVGLASSDLTTLLADHVFNYPGAPISNLKVEVMPDGIRQTGTLHKGVNIPFDMTSSIAMAPDGRIQLSAKRVKIFGVDGLVLMRALGLSLEKMMDLSGAHGISVKGNDLFLEPLSILPPPVIHGKVTGIRIEAGQLVQTIGDARDTTLPPQVIDSTAKNYMLYTRGTLHFGKLYMPEAELLVVDADQSTPFDFDNPNYLKQLIAGHSRTLPSLGLEQWMPDAYSLKNATVAAAKPRH